MCECTECLLNGGIYMRTNARLGAYDKSVRVSRLDE